MAVDPVIMSMIEARSYLVNTSPKIQIENKELQSKVTAPTDEKRIRSAKGKHPRKEH